MHINERQHLIGGVCAALVSQGLPPLRPDVLAMQFQPQQQRRIVQQIQVFVRLGVPKFGIVKVHHEFILAPVQVHQHPVPQHVIAKVVGDGPAGSLALIQAIPASGSSRISCTWATA